MNLHSFDFYEIHSVEFVVSSVELLLEFVVNDGDELLREI